MAWRKESFYLRFRRGMVPLTHFDLQMDNYFKNDRAESDCISLVFDRTGKETRTKTTSNRSDKFGLV